MSSYLQWLSARLSEHVSLDGRFGTAPRHVIGWAIERSAAQITPFVRSLRSAFADELTLIIDPDPELAGLLEAAEVRAIIPPRAIGWTPDVSLTRIAVFEHLLRRMADDAAVVLTGVGSVVFQGDPLCPPPALIEAFAGARGVTPSDPITALHSGTVVGPAAALAHLCRVALEAMSTAGPHAECPGADLPGVRLAASSHRFAVAGPADQGRTRLIDGVLVNPDGVVSPILHGYDNQPRLVEAVERRWGGAAPQRFRRHGRRLLAPLDPATLPYGRRLSRPG